MIAGQSGRTAPGRRPRFEPPRMRDASSKRRTLRARLDCDERTAALTGIRSIRDYRTVCEKAITVGKPDKIDWLALVREIAM